MTGRYYILTASASHSTKIVSLSVRNEINIFLLSRKPTLPITEWSTYWLLFFSRQTVCEQKHPKNNRHILVTQSYASWFSWKAVFSNSFHQSRHTSQNNIFNHILPCQISQKYLFYGFALSFSIFSPRLNHLSQIPYNFNTIRVCTTAAKFCTLKC